MTSEKNNRPKRRAILIKHVYQNGSYLSLNSQTTLKTNGPITLPRRRLRGLYTAKRRYCPFIFRIYTKQSKCPLVAPALKVRDRQEELGLTNKANGSFLRDQRWYLRRRDSQRSVDRTRGVGLQWSADKPYWSYASCPFRSQELFQDRRWPC